MDCELLAEVYLELMGGRQQGLMLDAAPPADPSTAPDDPAPASTGYRPPPRPRPLPPRITETEQAAHDAFIAEMGERALWNKA